MYVTISIMLSQVRILYFAVCSLLVAQSHLQCGAIPVKIFYDEAVRFSDLPNPQWLQNHTGDGKNYRTLIFSNDTTKLYVGGQQLLLEVQPSDFIVSQELHLNETGEMHPEYVRIIQPIDEGNCLFVCSANTMEAKCYFVNTTDLSVTINADAQYSNDRAVPVKPDQSTIWINVPSEHKIFTAVGMIPSVTTKDRFQLINLNSCGAPYVERIVSEDNAMWTNEPNFVGEPINYEDYIYFFFREYATEHINGGKIVYSRVARVCKSDVKGEDFSELGGEFTTYQKARLDCSNRGTNGFKFEYNDIQDIYQLNVTVFAVFATPKPASASSAVCAYNLEEIKQLFDSGEFKGQSDAAVFWTKPDPRIVPTPRPYQCTHVPYENKDDDYKFIQDYPLMNELVPNKFNYQDTSAPLYTRPSDNPLYEHQGKRFVQIVVDQSPNDLDVMFLGTERGMVIKAYLTSGKSEVRLIDEIDLNMDDKQPQVPVLSMLKDSKQEAIYVGTDNSVYKLPLQMCSYKTRCKCALDPYCTLNGVNCQLRTSYRAEEETTIPSDCNVGNINILMKSNSTLRIPTNSITQVAVIGCTSDATDLSAKHVVCSDCPSVVETITKTIDRDWEFLTVILSVTVTSDCQCSVTFTANNSEDKTSVTTIKMDTSEPLNKECFERSQTYDNEISKYLFDKKEWTNHVIQGSKNGTCEKVVVDCKDIGS